MAEQETIADIIAEMRHIGLFNDWRASIPRPKYIRKDCVNRDVIAKALLSLADRFEAAHKREVRETEDLFREALKKQEDTLRDQYEALVGFSNIAKLREALVNLDKWLFVGVDGYVHGQPDKTSEIERTIKDALAATSTAEKPSAVGDAAKLREALVKARHFIDSSPLVCIVDNTGTIARGELCAEIDGALAAPPRNCDRYATVDEARAAHEAICEKYGKCHNGCPLNNEEHYSAFDCFEAWLFAPATEGGDDENE